MNKSRDANFRVVAALLFACAAGLFAGSSGSNAGTESGMGAGPVAGRGILIPARLRLMVKFRPAQSA